jgi:hypothetical protein
MVTAQAKLQKWLDANDIVLSINTPKIRTLTDGAVLLEYPTIAVSYTRPQEEVSDEPTLQKKGGKKNG